MPKPMRAILGALLLMVTIGLVTCQSVFIDADAESEVDGGIDSRVDSGDVRPDLIRDESKDGL